MKIDRAEVQTASWLKARLSGRPCSACTRVLPPDAYYKGLYECKECNKKRRNEHLKSNPEYRQKRRDWLNEYRLQQKTDILTHYSNGTGRCVRCGFADLRALSLDHVDGSGNEHRRRDKIRNMYQWIAKQPEYPEGYQTLCMNCQFIKRHEQKECGKRSEVLNEN